MERKYVRNTFYSNWLFKYAWPLAFIVLLLILQHYPAFIENYYSTVVYRHLAIVCRIFTGWVPFSIGDVLYVLLGVVLFYKVIKGIIIIIRSRFSVPIILQKMGTLVSVLLWMYIIFLVCWGLNYNRLGLAKQLNIENNKQQSVEALRNFTCQLQELINVKRVALGDSNYTYPTDKVCIELVTKAYSTIEKKYPFLKYTFPSAKTSLLYQMVSSAGYSGYYNPFSGEAQINEDVPAFYKPFVIAHEIAHQIGYASESEASFTGYLVCMHSNNILLEYSALYELFASANNELFMYDFYAAYLNIKDLHPLVKRDRRIYRQYLLGKKNNFEPIIKNVYDQYLKANNQQNGIESYNEVLNWVMAFEKKYGTAYLRK